MINDGVEPEMVKDIVTGNVDMDLGETEVTPVPMIDRVIEEPEEEVVIKRKEVAEGEAKKYVVYYNLDKSYLSENDKVVLNELVSQLKKKKELNAVIGSFTDCSMDMDYNIQLSNRRSAAVTKYLKEMGVAAGRIIESHYGKSYLVQQCEENKYDVKEQLANRRSEIYVTENKKKSWDALSKEFANPPTVYSKDIENREPMSTPRKDGRGRARDIRGGRNAIGQTDVTLNDNNTQSQSDNESVAAEKSNKGRGQSQSMMDGDTIVFVIYFNMDQYDLGNSFGTLLGLKDLMKTFSDYQCILTGHTDNEGSAAYDQKLSERRANTVKNYFISYGIDPARLKSIGYGSRKSANKSEVEVAEGWKNRRVEVRLYR
jgi:outer membrane protein OmpA-like peptidoglycan-associated protein